MKREPRRSGCLVRGLRWLGILAVLAVVILAISSVNQRLALDRFRQASPPPGSLVTVNGRQQHLYCLGSGGPTVVIDAGNSSYSLEWVPLQRSLSEATRICTYDRAGYGWSAPGPTPRDSATEATELYDLLQAAGEPGPYLLVGHSLGGMNARLFTAAHPDEVAGLVLIDTAAAYDDTPELQASMRASLSTYSTIELAARSGLLRVLGPLLGGSSVPPSARDLPLDLQDAYRNLMLNPQHYATAASEVQALPTSLAQAAQALTGPYPLGDRPVIVLTAGMQPVGSSPLEPILGPRPYAEIEAQGRLVELSRAGEQRVIAESGHLMHVDAPEAVRQAVLDAVAAAR